jgi:gluconolactonase
MALGPGGTMILCNNGGFTWHDEPGLLRPTGQAADYAGGRVEVVDLATGQLRTLYDRCGEHRLKGPNDLQLDGRGGFWFSDLGKSRARDRDHGGVYWAALDGSRIVEAAFPVPGGANGIGISPEGETLYVAEPRPAASGPSTSWHPAVCASRPGRARMAATSCASSPASAGSTAWPSRRRATSWWRRW